MSDKSTEIVELLAPTVQSMGLELLGIEYLPAPGGALLRLYIDVPQDADPERQVGIEDCEAVSHEVSAQLDVADPISSHYTLEVSSPGVDRPLFTAAQFARFTGQSAKVVLKLPQDGRRRLTGRIDAVEDGSITFDIDGNPFVAAVDNIEKARLVPDWEALGLVKHKPGKGPARGKAGRNNNQTTNEQPANGAADAE
ncbi:MAG: ribosome maturation factor RimP [Pseudoxanthomonas suwonensis]|nr:ribosome maturation factor RimP [Pseudoxanthomonas suwonensis]